MQSQKTTSIIKVTLKEVQRRRSTFFFFKFPLWYENPVTKIPQLIYVNLLELITGASWLMCDRMASRQRSTSPCRCWTPPCRWWRHRWRDFDCSSTETMQNSWKPHGPHLRRGTGCCARTDAETHTHTVTKWRQFGIYIIIIVAALIIIIISYISINTTKMKKKKGSPQLC